MTTCAECLTALSTMRLSEIRKGSPVEEHYSTCENCSRVAADIQYAEHRLALALSELHPSALPEVIAEDAVIGSSRLRRRRVAAWFRAVVIALGAILLATYVIEKRDSSLVAASETQTVMLKCAPADVAVSLVTPYLRSNGSMVYRVGEAQMVIIRGKHDEIERAISQIDQYEARFCSVPAPGQPVIPSAEKQGKD